MNTEHSSRMKLLLATRRASAPRWEGERDWVRPRKMGALPIGLTIGNSAA